MAVLSPLPRPLWTPALGPRERHAALMALVLSVGAHLAALILAPDWRKAPPAPTPLRVTLLPAPALPAPPQPMMPPQALPTPTPPRQPRPATDSAPPKPAPSAVLARAMPNPAPATPTSAPASALPVEPPVAIASGPASAPSPPPASSTPAAVPDSNSLARYGDSLSSLLARQQQYPRQAAARGWEGDVVLVLVIARKGNLVAARVARSSGHAVLDQHALALVAEVQPFPAMPGALTGDELEVTVPIRYHLNKNG